MTWIIEIMSNVKGHKNKPSIFKSKKATRQPSNLCPPPLRPSQWLLIYLTHCNVTMIFSLSHTFFSEELFTLNFIQIIWKEMSLKKKIFLYYSWFCEDGQNLFLFFYFPFQIPFTTPDAKCLHSLFCDIHRVSILSTPLVWERKLNVMRKGS